MWAFSGWSTSQRTKLTANTQHTRHIVCIKSGVQKSESHRGSCQARKLQCSDHHLHLHHAALTLEARSPSDWSWIFRNLKQCGQRHRRISHCYSVCYILHIVHVCKPRFQWTETLRRIKCHEVVNVWCSGLSSTNLRGVPCRQRPRVRPPTCQVDPSYIKLSPKDSATAQARAVPIGASDSHRKLNLTNTSTSNQVIWIDKWYHTTSPHKQMFPWTITDLTLSKWRIKAVYCT